MAAKSLIHSVVKKSNKAIQNKPTAPQVWSSLNGVINVYKPAGLSLTRVSQTIVGNICRDLNELHVRPPNNIVSIDDNAKGSYSVTVKPSYADNVLVVGPRYQSDDMRINSAAPLGRNTSGVLLFGINHGCRMSHFIHLNKPTRAYHITGKFGEATDTYFSDGKIVEKAKFHRIRRSHIDSLLASMQASHQKKMFEQCGLNLQSQAAYELALKGPIRPADNKLPVIYGLKCIDFKPPLFTIEVQCVNEYEQYMMTLIHEIGYLLHSVAHCSKIRCIRHGHFSIDNSLLRRHWDLHGISFNMAECKEILTQHPHMLKQTNANLM